MTAVVSRPFSVVERTTPTYELSMFLAEKPKVIYLFLPCDEPY